MQENAELYQNDVDITHVLTSHSPMNLSFEYFDMEEGYDSVSIRSANFSMTLSATDATNDQNDEITYDWGSGWGSYQKKPKPQKSISYSKNQYSDLSHSEILAWSQCFENDVTIHIITDSSVSRKGFKP